MSNEDGQRELPYLSEIENFVLNSVWKYMAEEISAVMMQAAMENDDVDPYKDPAKLCRNQGTINFGKMILDMPAQMAEEIKSRTVRETTINEEED